MILESGSLLNERYRIVTVLGQGGMGAVYRAVDERLGSPVAVKENLNLAEEFARQFKKEAVTLASLRHPSLPRVADYFAFPRQGQYLVMDYIEGEDLRQRIERAGNLSDQDVVLIGESVCDALTYLHTRVPPVIHRDIKPGNIKIAPDQRVYLVDFGLVKQDYADQATTTGARAMTPGYSPPEQYGSARTDARTDVYSLAATLYAALTGSIPEDSISRAAKNVALTPILNLNPNSSRHLAATIEKGLELDAAKRFQTADEFRSALLESLELTSRFEMQPRITAPPPEAVDIIPFRENLDEIYSPPIAPVLSPAQKFRSRLMFYSTLAIAIIIVGSFFVPWKNLPSFRQDNFETLQLSKTSDDTQPSINVTNDPGLSYPPGIESNQGETPVISQPPGLVATPQPTLQGGSSQIAFASDRTGNFQIWVVNFDGSNQRQITGLAEGACQPAWSPDGTRLAFISPCGGKKEIYQGAHIYIADDEGKNVQPLSTNLNSAGDFSPSWSPDGKMIVFASLRSDTKPHLSIYSLEDSSIRTITDAAYGDLQPAWSPSGLQIAFARQFPNTQIWVTDLSGKQQFQYSPSGAVMNQKPEWSKDGSILFYSQMDPVNNIPYLVGLPYENRGKNFEIRIPAGGTAEIGPLYHPAISPDGQWIAYESWPDGINHDLYMITINGTDRRRLTTDKDWDFGPSWKPQESSTK